MRDHSQSKHQPSFGKSDTSVHHPKIYSQFELDRAIDEVHNQHVSIERELQREQDVLVDYANTLRDLLFNADLPIPDVPEPFKSGYRD